MHESHNKRGISQPSFTIHLSRHVFLPAETLFSVILLKPQLQRFSSQFFQKRSSLPIKYLVVFRKHLLRIWASLIVQLVKNPPATQETPFNSWVGKIRWRRDRLPTPVFLGFRRGLADKRICLQCGRLGSIPGLGRSPREGKGYPLQYSGLENSMGCIVHGVAKSWTRLSNFPFISLKIYSV